jgi:hypothetical protein
LTEAATKEPFDGNQHRRLVKRLIDELVKSGVRILTADFEGYLKPRRQGRHEPDVVGEDSSGLLVIGEAKLCQDLTTLHTYEQLRDFSSRQMGDGALEGVAVPFHIIIPMDCSPELHRILKDLNLHDKDNIHIWLSG